MNLLKGAGLFLLQTNSDSESVFDGPLGTIIIWLAFLAFIGFFVWLIIRYFMRLAKKEVVKNKLNKIEQSDPFWDQEKMKEVVQFVHSQAHIAWARRSSYYITGLATDELIKKWEKIWDDLQSRGLAFHSIQPEIDSIVIVGAEDSSDNNKDQFTAEVAAYVIRYVYDKETRQPIDGHYNGKNLVYDHFIFNRINNKWILSDVKFYIALNDTMKMKTEQEKPGRPDDV